MKKINASAVLILLTLVLGCLCTGFLLSKGSNRLHLDTQRERPTPAETETIDPSELAADGITLFPININTADLDTLMMLPEIGEILGQRIIDYRQEFGLFHSIGDIMEVRGIGGNRFEEIKNYITVGDVAAVSEETQPLPDPVNINTADEKTLMTLPGIGKTSAQRIIAYREENGYFTSIEELMEVEGIGQSRFDKLKDYITVEDTHEDTGS